MQSGKNCAIQVVCLIWKQKIWLAICELLCPLTNRNACFITFFASNYLFCTVLRKNCIVLSQSESSHFFMYIIKPETIDLRMRWHEKLQCGLFPRASCLGLCVTLIFNNVKIGLFLQYSVCKFIGFWIFVETPHKSSVPFLPIQRLRRFCQYLPCQQRLFLCSLTGEKRPLPWVANGVDSTAVRSLGRLYLKRVVFALFADCNLSLLRLAHFFTLIPPSFIEPTL